MLRQLQNTPGNASAPATCAKDADCTAVTGYAKGCCAKYDPGAPNATVLAEITKTLPAAAGKFCANDGLKTILDA